MAKNPRPLLFVDIETTGHEPLVRVGDWLAPWHEIIDIGAVAVFQPNLVAFGEFQRRVKPLHPERCEPDLVNHYEERAARGEWDNALTLEDAIASFLRFASGADAVPIMGGQNFFFDKTFLAVAFAWCSIRESERNRHFHYSSFDTRSMAIQELALPGEIIDPLEYSIRTGRLLERLGLEPEPEVHEAINGARKAFEVYKKLKRIRAER